MDGWRGQWSISQRNPVTISGVQAYAHAGHATLAQNEAQLQLRVRKQQRASKEYQLLCNSILVLVLPNRCL